jgi:hypothetical protein
MQAKCHFNYRIILNEIPPLIYCRVTAYIHALLLRQRIGYNAGYLTEAGSQY